MGCKRRLLMMGAGIISSYTAFGFVEPKARDHEPALTSSIIAKQKVLRLTTKTAPVGLKGKQAGAQSLHLDPHSGAIRVLTGPFHQVPKIHGLNQEDYIQTAKDFIDNHFSIFGVHKDELKLVPKAILLDQNDQFIKFHIYRDGIRISDAAIDFRFKFGRLSQVINQSFSEATIAAKEARSPSEIDAAAAELLAQGDAIRKEDAFRVEKSAKGYQLIPVTNYELKGDHLHHDLQINQINGKVHELKDRHYHVDGQVTIEAYPRWYNENLVTVPFPDGHVTVDSARTLTNNDGVFTVTTSSILAPKVDGLTGNFVTLELESGEKLIRSGDKVGDLWNVHINRQDTGSKWLDKQTAQSMIYMSTTNIVKEAKRFIANPWLDRPLVANANLNSTCNAHWDGSTINLYSGDNACANTGLIADVIYHEWGHGLDDATGGIDDGALSEGFGDIMSLVMTRSSQLGIGFRLPDYRPVRELETDKIYPRDTGEVHAEGLIIGSTFWDLFVALKTKYNEDDAVELLKKYAFKMIFTARTYLDVYNALLVIDDDDANLSNGTPNKCLLNKVFNAHGLTQIDQGCLLASIDAFDMFDSDGDNILEPGEAVELTVSVKNQTPKVIPSLNGTLSIKEGSFVTVENGAFHWENLPAQGKATSQDKGFLQIAPEAVCGSHFTTELKLQAKEGQEEREVSIFKNFVIGKNVGASANYPGTNLPLDILDNRTVHVNFPTTNDQWEDSTLVEAARLSFALEHSYLGDVVIYLVAPDESQIEVYRGKGMDGEVRYNEDVTKLIAGKKGKGLWKLAVVDQVSRDEGIMTAAALELTPAKYVCNQ